MKSLFDRALLLDFSTPRKYDDAMPVDPDDLRVAMRRWATGVTVVSAAEDDVRYGMTVSSFTSVSLEPPLVLVSLDTESITHHVIERMGYFGVSILTKGQQDLSDRFSGRIQMDRDRFTGLETYTLVTGSPLLFDTLAALDCRVVSSYKTGTRTVFIGEVLAVRNGAENSPLLYFNQNYRSLMEQGEHG